MQALTQAAVATKQRASELRTVFAEVDDPRSRESRHCLIDMIFIALCASICGCNSWTDVEFFGKQKVGWLSRFLSLRNGIPSHDTFSRVFNSLNEDQMCEALVRWLALLGKTTDGQHIAIDGKSFRRSFDSATGSAMLHLVNAWSTESGICFGQQSVGDKSNEITAVPKLLDLMKINGATITLDAMHCQTATARKIIERGANYVISAKNNQPTLFEDIQQAFIDAEETVAATKAAGLRTATQQPVTPKAQSRTNTIKRVCSVMPVPARMKKIFPGLKSIVRMYREQTRTDKNEDPKTTESVTFFVSSLPPTVRTHAKLIQDHWKVENQLHWTMDMTFNEDQKRNRKNNGAAISGFINRLALSILKQDTSLQKMSLVAKRKVCGWDNDTLEAVLCHFHS